MGDDGARAPPLEFDARKILQPFFVSTYRPITHIKALIAVTVAGCCKKNFSHIRFCRPNARWLSLLDDFVTTNFGTRAPCACAPLEQNSGDATARWQSCDAFADLVDWARSYPLSIPLPSQRIRRLDVRPGSVAPPEGGSFSPSGCTER